jgi:predicted Zn finger-like uncharacterized protein
MASLFDDRPLALECPVCRATFKKKIRGLRKPNVKCPKCGTLFDTTALRASFDKAEQVLGKLQRQLKHIEISFTD